MDFSEILLKFDVKERIQNLNRRLRKNEILSHYYESLYEEVSEDWDNNMWEWSDNHLQFMDRFRRHCRSSINAVNGCSRFFNVDYYPFQAVKDMVGTSTCSNKFCDSCQNTLSVQRERRYAPILDELARCFDIAHAVFTVPNCEPSDLKAVVDNMFENFKYMVRYLSCKKKIRHIDFTGYGFEGGIRALEITKNQKTGQFHPHLHCILIFRKGLGLNFNRKHLNSFSFDNEHYKSHHKGKEIRYFTDFEILLQKIWYLRINGIEVTRDSISNLKEGYSVICEHAEKYKEVFKYATKGIIKADEQLNFLQSSYYDFANLCYSLYRKRIVQAFGCLWGCDFSDSIDLSAENDLKYQKVVERLRQLEKPIEMLESLKEITENREKDKNIRYISRSNVEELMAEDYETT